MGTIAPANTQIFFKDKQNVLKGPFTERQVQEWYRKGWFLSSFPFYFMHGYERPNDDTKYCTLDELCKRNGIGCPFVLNDSSREDMNGTVERLEKELAELSATCAEVQTLEKRVEEAEKLLKDLETQTPSTSVHIEPSLTKQSKREETKNAAAQPDKGEQEHLLANQWTAYYLEILEAYKTGNTDKVIGKEAAEFLNSIHHLFIHRPVCWGDIQRCRDALLKRLKEIDYAYCAECDAVLQSYRLIMLHVRALDHCFLTQEDINKCMYADDWKSRQKVVNMIMNQMAMEELDSISQEEDKQIVEEDDRKIAHVFGLARTDPSTFLPTPEFIAHFKSAFADVVFDLISNKNLTRAQLVTGVMSRLKHSEIICRNMRQALRDHIGNGKTRCGDCRYVTGSIKEYFVHLRSYKHLRQTKGLDLITLVINMYMNDDE